LDTNPKSNPINCFHDLSLTNSMQIASEYIIFCAK
jgi:hypothetical protein